MRARIVALLAAVALVVTACGTGSEVAAGDGGIGSGIGVHGAWSIDVYDADGSLAQSAAFHNDLTDSGKNLLLQLLSRERTLGAWGIRMSDVGVSPLQPCSDGTADAPCQAVEPGWPHDGNGTNIFETLTVTTIVSPDFTVTLAGSATATNTTEIQTVSSIFETCSSSVTPTACGDDSGSSFSSGGPLTTAVVSALDWDGDGNANDGPIPVTAGQTIQVTVEISFGTLP